MAGRKSKLTKELITQISDLLIQGNCVNWVCDYVGISEDCFYRWLKEGETASKKSLKYEFYESIKESKAQAQIEMVKQIKEGSKKNPKWAAWYLERTDPKNWAEKKNLDLTVKEHKTLDDIPTEELKKLVSKFIEENES